MKYRKLRIAWSVGWAIAAVLLVALWVRSYSMYDCVYGEIGMASYQLTSYEGVLAVVVPNGKASNGPVPKWNWEVSASYPGAARNITQIFRARRATVVPYWLMLFSFACSASLASQPWFAWRFSLRTLLIATTLVAVVLGVIVYVMRQ